MQSGNIMEAIKVQNDDYVIWKCQYLSQVTLAW